MKKIENESLEIIASVYSILNDICANYSRMTDGYSLATGDNKFENMPKEIVDMISDRQRFFTYREITKNALIKKITPFFEDVE